MSRVTYGQGRSLGIVKRATEFLCAMVALLAVSLPLFSQGSHAFTVPALRCNNVESGHIRKHFLSGP